MQSLHYLLNNLTPLISRSGFCLWAHASLLQKHICKRARLHLLWNTCLNNHFLSVLSFQELKRVKCQQVECSPSWGLSSLLFPELSPSRAAVLCLHLWTWSTLSPEDTHKTGLHTSPPPPPTSMITSELPVLQWVKNTICRKRKLHAFTVQKKKQLWVPSYKNDALEA